MPEKRFLKSIMEKELSLVDIGKKSGLDKNELNISIGQLRRQGAIDVRKDKGLIISITDSGKKLLKEENELEKFLKNNFPIPINDVDKKLLDELQKRKEIIKKDVIKSKDITLTSLGEKLSKIKMSDKVVDKLTSKMLKDGSWEKADFRSFDVEINVPAIHGGKRHFTNQAVEYIKDIWRNLGFKEMTGNMVQTGFWDLDSLFVPQDHPAREMQDTFYLKDPQKGKLPNKKLVSNVKNTHENGWTTGSLGWRGEWSEDKASNNMLRTHNTVLSAQTISKLKESDLPQKFFAVGKVFRNETLDWKHLFEFYQVEGIVVDPDANFSNLIGYLKEFFEQMGFPDVRVRPAHFPYTEPSAEVDVWNPKKKQWVEIAGSGIFRPETTKPLIGKSVPVCAWGIGLGRLITEYWGLTDLRDLYKNDLKQLREMKTWLR
ncbi:phenylalanine--tRNA ligase subunit alpha, partial [archaeon]|nr:phenylalanine--tRNA ligase subunit alpha [archaeon]